MQSPIRCNAPLAKSRTLTTALFSAFAMALAGFAAAGPPAHFVSRGPGGGVTWTNIPPDIWSPSVYCLFADPLSTNRLLVSDYEELKLSTNSGATYSLCYSNHDLLIAGAFWDGPSIYVGTRPGLVISTNGGSSFTFVGTPGIPATEELVSFAGAKENGTLRFFCVTFGAGDVWPGIEGSEYPSYVKIYRLDGGTGTWTVATNGVAGNHLAFVAMCRTNISLAYAAGSDSLGQPVVLKTVNGGSSWSQVMQCTGNANVATGWTGDDPGGWNWKKWSFGECAMGFTVCQSDPNRAPISDFGFIHVTTNGGTTWQQAYDWPGCRLKLKHLPSLDLWPQSLPQPPDETNWFRFSVQPGSAANSNT